MNEFWNSVLVKKSRKKHNCEYCGAVIEVGTSYSRQSGKFEGEIQDYALCLRCRQLLDSNNPTWAMDDGELGNFHDAFMDSKFIQCPSCKSRYVGEVAYSRDMTRVTIICDKCDEIYRVSLDAETLLHSRES